MLEHSIFGSRIHLVCIAVSLLICSISSYGETVEIKTALKFPILSNGKIAGYSTAATGSKVEVLTRDGDKLQVRYRAFEPIWIQNSDIIEKTKDSGSESDQQDDSTSFDPQKAIGAMASENTDTLVGILKGKKYPDNSLQISFEKSITNFVKSKLDLAIASQKKPQIDKEVERLRRNADVTGRPNLLNPSDRSGQERAQRIRSEADSLETKANQEIAKCEERLESAQVTLSDYLNNWSEAEKRIQEQERLAEEKKHQSEAEAKLNQEIEASKLASIQKEQERLAEEKKHQAEAPIAAEPSPSASPQSQIAPQSVETSTPQDISSSNPKLQMKSNDDHGSAPDMIIARAAAQEVGAGGAVQIVESSRPHVSTHVDLPLNNATVSTKMVTVAGGRLLQESEMSEGQRKIISAYDRQFGGFSEMKGQLVSSFQIGKYEVTWGEWKEVRDWAVANNKGYDLIGLGDTFPRGSGDNFPVIEVNWYDVVKWCNAKSEMDRIDPVYQVNGKVYRTGEFESDVVEQKSGAKGYRLPTAAEWEWAARGGKKSNKYTYAGSNDLDAVGWFTGNAEGKTHEIGEKLENELGICDMSGNVWEWCENLDGISNRSLRGGSFADNDAHAAVAQALCAKSSIRNIDLGFRLARSSEN